mgnify:CR=1 FL=1
MEDEEGKEEKETAVYIILLPIIKEKRLERKKLAYEK